MTEVTGKSVKITADEAKAHELPPVEIRIDLGESGLAGMKFPDKGQYLSLSGPPGGPLGLVIRHIDKLPKSEADWHKLAENRYADGSMKFGKVEKIEFNGKKQDAYTVATGAGPARANHLLIAIAVPVSGDAILVDYHRAGGNTEVPPPISLASDKIFSEISPSISIKFE